MSLSAHSTLWSEQQREWLQALGHEVLMFVPGSLAVTSATPAPAADTIRDVGKPSSAAGSPRLPAQPAVAGSTISDSPLLLALARAAGRQSQDAEFLRALPDLSTLQGSPVARRKLWPLLRALRKAGQR
ncbi:MAG TPA: hypothetical protein VGQ93_01715 [Lysobacter sp.]|jgi:hypothetical protein|nr:hypothetical protein [Lysobacter sp.]